MNYISYRDLGTNGRLGNQLFQIAATISVANKYSATAIFPHWKYKKHFDPSPFCHFGVDVEPSYHYREPSFSFKEIDWNNADEVGHISNPQHKMLNLHGYFQSEKYFDSCKRIILSSFTPTRQFFDQLQIKASANNWPSNEMTCSIHVRRGDYVGNNYYAQLGREYYYNAILFAKQIAKNRELELKKFVVFSDDIDYCRSLFNGDEFVFVSGTSDIEDLLLMSYCDYHIGANSSFSWWGAYFDQKKGKVDVFPKEWFGPSANHDTKDLYTENMIRI